MDRKDLTFRRMIVRDVNGKVVNENIVVVDRNEIEKDADVKTFGYVGGIDYSENPEGSFKEYSNAEKSKLGYGQKMSAFDKIQAKELGMNATFEMLSCEDMKSAMQAFQQAYSNIQVPTNTKQMEKLMSDTNLATNTAYTASMNLSKDEITTQYNCLKACYELGGVASYDNEGLRRVGNYNTLSAFDKDFVDAACKEQAYAEDVSIIMAADRYGLVNAPKKVSGFDLTPVDRLSLDATGVSLSHNIGAHSSEGFLISKDIDGNYNVESTKYTDKMSVQGQVYKDSISNNVTMTAVKAYTIGNLAAHNIQMTALKVKDTCKTSWKNYCTNVKRNYDTVKTGLRTAGVYAKDKVIDTGKFVGNKTIDTGKAISNKTVDTGKAISNKVVANAQATRNAVVETKDTVVKHAKTFASGVKTSAISKYHKFRNMLTDARDYVNDSVNQGIVNVSDKFIRNIQGVRTNAERRIKRSNNTINVNKVTAQGAEINQSALERQGEFVTE